MSATNTLWTREHEVRERQNPAEGRRPHWSWLVARGLGALALLAVGTIHLQQYLGPYSAIPTIGTLFLLNFAAAIVIGAALVGRFTTRAPTLRW